MTAKQAYELIRNELTDLVGVKCFEYENLFVFSMVAEKQAHETDVDELLDVTYSVDKETGEVRDFKPFHISLDDYRSGKQIADFE